MEVNDARDASSLVTFYSTFTVEIPRPQASNRILTDQNLQECEAKLRIRNQHCAVLPFSM